MTTEARRRGPRGPYAKSAERRAAIVEAASGVFAARGYRAGSFQEVADVVGMSQTSLLHYFPSKQALLLAVLDHRDSLLGGSVQRTPGPDFRTGVLRQAEYNSGVPGLIELYSVLAGEAATQDHPGRAWFIERFTTLRGNYEAEFQALKDAGRLRDGIDPARAAAGFVALWDGIQLQWLLDPEAVDVVAVLRDHLDLVILP
ncbi:TetR/AcrR family transcriptional regulator [Frondihabitans cladoniiphilus]|uniref:TetR/AcrR family transcriptional regulator n=1 Tax=Frondihabitans cladoniiphilus TaxID=715785 RepID=A0ABP8WAE6_9MICO